MQTVQKWEKCLTLISEIIDEWQSVQRKYLYLEGIFVGGDIRVQLPEEAKKFDDIDRRFKRVSWGLFVNQVRSILKHRISDNERLC